MENQERKEENILMVRHVLGNIMGSTKGRYAFLRINNEALTKEFIQEAEWSKREAIKLLEERLKIEGILDEAMSTFMDELKASDWSTEESLLVFLKKKYMIHLLNLK